VFAQLDWLHLIAFIAGGLVGLFLCGAMRDGKLSDLMVEAEYYKRLAERKKEE
jgi:hypothetical protein